MAGMRLRWIQAACLAATWATACPSSSTSPENCGLAIRPGEYRFCSSRGDMRCVCATNRCARAVDTAVCPAGWQYAYGQAECVPGDVADTIIESYAAGHNCPGADADADGDADGGAEVEGGEDAEPEEGEGDDGGAPPPTVSGAIRITSERGEDPRAVPFGDHVLVDHTGDETLPAGSPGRDSILFHTVEWDAAEPALVDRIDASGSPDTDANVWRATAWASCRNASDASSALFGHWRNTHDGPWPLFLSARWDGDAATVEDVTDTLVTTADVGIMSFRIVSDGDNCFLVGLWDTDGPGGTPAELRARRIAEPDGPDGWGPVQALVESGGWAFDGAREPTDPVEAMAFPDGEGGLVVAVPTRNAVTGAVGYVGQHIDDRGRLAWVAGSTAGQAILEYPPTAGLAGFEMPWTDGMLVASGTVIVAATAVRGANEHVLFYTQTPLSTGTGLTSPTPLRETGFTYYPQLASAPDGALYLGWWEWSGGWTPPVDTYVMRLDAPAEPVVVAASVTIFPRFVTDAGQRLLVSWLAATTGATTGIAALRLTPDLVPAPGWPAEGVEVKPADSEIGGMMPETPAPLPAPDGGALFFWTQIDSDTRAQYVYVRRLFAAL